MGLEIHILDSETGKVKAVCLEQKDAKVCYGDASILSKAIHIMAMSIAHLPFASDMEGPNGA